MKQLFLIITLLLVATTMSKAQNKNAIEVKIPTSKNGELLFNDGIIGQGHHEFVLLANEEAEVNLKFILKKEGDLNVLVKDKNMKVVYSKKYTRKGENFMNFTMEENDEYTVTLSSSNDPDLTVSLRENS